MTFHEVIFELTEFRQSPIEKGDFMSTVFIILLVILLIIVGIILFVNIGIRFAIFTASTFIDIIKSPASLFLIMCFIVVAILALIINQKSARDSSYAPSNDIPVTTEYKRSLPETQKGPYQKSNEGEYKPNQSAQENHNYIMDSRDGKTYKTVKIGNQVWMAENLNYETNGSYCYEDDPEKCVKYGRLYIWESALNACPDGWHLPTKEEIETLLSYVQKKEETELPGFYLLRSSNLYGFSALLAGERYNNGKFSFFGLVAFFWSVSENGSYSAYAMSLDDLGEDYISGEDKNYGRSVRCLRDP